MLTKPSYSGLIILSNKEFVEAKHTQCIKKLASYLCHNFPKVRRAAAEQFYVALTSDGLGEFDEKVEELLIGTDWDLPMETLKPIRDEILEALHLN